MNDNNMYLHDVNLGEPMDAEGIERALMDHSDSPAVRAVLHLLRNSAADADRNARSEVEHRDLMLGKATACEDTFWTIYRAIGGVGVVFEGGSRVKGQGATGNAVPDPDEAEHAAGGEE